MIKAADYMGRLDVAAITAAARRVARPRGIRQLRAFLADYDDVPGVAFTVLERRLRTFCKLYGIPTGEPQAKILLPDRTQRRADVFHAAEGVVVELDSRSAHERLGAMADDRRRDHQLGAVGLHTFRIVGPDMDSGTAPTTARLLLNTLAIRRSSDDVAA